MATLDLGQLFGFFDQNFGQGGRQKKAARQAAIAESSAQEGEAAVRAEQNRQLLSWATANADKHPLAADLMAKLTGAQQAQFNLDTQRGAQQFAETTLGGPPQGISAVQQAQAGELQNQRGAYGFGQQQKTDQEVQGMFGRTAPAQQAMRSDTGAALANLSAGNEIGYRSQDIADRKGLGLPMSGETASMVTGFDQAGLNREKLALEQYLAEQGLDMQKLKLLGEQIGGPNVIVPQLRPMVNQFAKLLGYDMGMGEVGPGGGGASDAAKAQLAREQSAGGGGAGGGEPNMMSQGIDAYLKNFARFVPSAMTPFAWARHPMQGRQPAPQGPPAPSGASASFMFPGSTETTTTRPAGVTGEPSPGATQRPYGMPPPRQQQPAQPVREPARQYTDPSTNPPAARASVPQMPTKPNPLDVLRQAGVPNWVYTKEGAAKQIIQADLFGTVDLKGTLQALERDGKSIKMSSEDLNRVKALVKELIANQGRY